MLSGTHGKELAKHRGLRQCSYQGGAAFAGKLVLMKKQSTVRFPSIHTVFAVMRASVLGRQVPVLGRKTVAPYPS